VAHGWGVVEARGDEAPTSTWPRTPNSAVREAMTLPVESMPESVRESMPASTPMAMLSSMSISTPTPASAPVALAAPTTPQTPLAPLQLSISELPVRLPGAMRLTLETGRQEVRVQLSPPELGAIEVRLWVEEDRVSAHLIAARPEVRSLLREMRGELERGMKQAGLNVEALRVEAPSHTTALPAAAESAATSRAEQELWPQPSAFEARPNFESRQPSATEGRAEWSAAFGQEARRDARGGVRDEVDRAMTRRSAPGAVLSAIAGVHRVGLDVRA